MVAGLLRALVVLVVLVAIGAFVFGERWGVRRTGAAGDGVVGTAGGEGTRERAREAGAEVGERLGEGADRIRQGTRDAALTARITSKMALDELVSARRIDVDTHASVVTLRGNVSSDAERTRALALARDTDGVTQVVDELRLSR